MRRSITVGSARAEPGQTSFGAIPAGEHRDGSPIEIPVGILNGKEDGTRLWMQAGVHGDEYVCMGAMAKLFQEIKPQNIRGALIAIPRLNVTAFQGRDRMSPLDGQDMNRIWPGAPLERAMHVRAHSEMAAHAVVEEMKQNADCLLDLHDGGIETRIAPYAAFYNVKDEKLTKSSLDLSIATGLKVVWETQMEFVKEKVPGSIKLVANELGIPSATLEAGGEGRLDPVYVGMIFDAFINVMKHFGMLPGKPEKKPGQVYVKKGNWIRATRGGLVWPKTEVTSIVKKGQSLAVITDFFGNEKANLKAPVDGIVIGIRTFGSAYTGQYCGNVGEVSPWPR